jgi:hypothetical protein
VTDPVRATDEAPDEVGHVVALVGVGQLLVGIKTIAH